MDKGPSFWKRLKENVRQIKHGKPGSRFLGCYRYKQELRHKYGSIYRRIDITLGCIVIFVGLVMVPLPGPGWIIVAAGLAMIAGESETVARSMDRIEVIARRFAGRVRRAWHNKSTAAKTAIALSCSAVASGLCYGVYLIAQALFA